MSITNKEEVQLKVILWQMNNIHFITCCETGKKARSDGDNGFMVTAILEQAEKVMLGERRKKLDEVNFALSRTKQ